MVVVVVDDDDDEVVTADDDNKAEEHPRSKLCLGFVHSQFWGRFHAFSFRVGSFPLKRRANEDRPEVTRRRP